MRSTLSLIVGLILVMAAERAAQTRAPSPESGEKNTPQGDRLVDVRGHDEEAVPALINKYVGVHKQTAATRARLKFTWDKVPVYIHVGKNAGFTSDEIRFVATHSDFVCLEKGHGIIPRGSTENGIEHDAARLKAINPDIRVMYYWNTFLDYSMYDAHEVYGQHEDWWLTTLDGSLDTKRGNLKRYDLSHPEVQEWWAEEVRKAVVDGSCDGVFMDAFPQITAAANKQLWGQKKYDAIQEGLIETIKLTREKIGPNNILMFNGIRNTNSLHFGLKHLQWTDAAKIEHFDQFESRDKENIVRDIEDMITAGKNGKIVIMKGWPGFNWLDRSIQGKPYDELLAKARQNITFPLACFLVAAQPHSYFCYAWGYREQHGSLSEYPEFQKPLGPPKGDAVRDGWQYSRQFEHCKVWVNVETKEARVDWGPRALELDDVVGQWQFDFVSDDGLRYTPLVTLKQRDGTLEGKIESDANEHELETVEIDGNQLIFGYERNYNGSPLRLTYICELSGDKLSGRLEYDVDGTRGDFPIEAVRERKGTNQSK